MSKNTITSDLVLEGQSNWELWIFVVKRIAEAGDVWEHVDPDQPHRPLDKPEKPVRPVPTIHADGTALHQLSLLSTLSCSTIRISATITRTSKNTDA